MLVNSEIVAMPFWEGGGRGVIGNLYASWSMS